MVLGVPLQSQLAPFFTSPAGLLAALSLIPLIIFYLVKPEPEEEIMPSMTFFMEKRQSDRVSRAINRLMSNLLLLLHVLFILGAAASIAGPLVPGFERPDHSVIVLDRSASMEDDLPEAKSFATSNLGEENTLILVDNEIRVLEERAPPSAVRARLNSIETRDVETDVAAGIQAAREYSGNVVLASDLDQTVDSRNVESLVESMKASRTVEIFDSSASNRWGIVDVAAGEENATVEVKNFEDSESTVNVAAPTGGTRLTVPANSVEPVTVAVSPGRNKVELGEDPVTADNTAYVSVPRNGSFDVTYLADSDNAYLREAVELISFTEYRYRAPPVEGSLDSDIYIVGESPDLLESTAVEIERQVKDEGSSLVLFQDSELQRFDSAPAELGDKRDATVEVREPVRTSFPTSVRAADSVNGTGLSTPREALVRSSFGRGEVLLYNVEDSDFRYEFVYPLFWKNVFERFTGRPSVGDLNRETGDELTSPEIRTPSGERVEDRVKMDTAGFYNGSSSVYAANLESPEESADRETKIESSGTASESTRGEARHLAAVLLAVLALLEIAYLVYTGEL